MTRQSFTIEQGVARRPARHGRARCSVGIHIVALGRLAPHVLLVGGGRYLFDLGTGARLSNSFDGLAAHVILILH